MVCSNVYSVSNIILLKFSEINSKNKNHHLCRTTKILQIEGFFLITLLALVTHLFKNNVYEYKLNFWQRFNSHVTNQESLYGFMRPGLVPCFNTQRTNLHSVQSPVTHQDMECLCSCYDRSTLMEMGWGGCP